SRTQQPDNRWLRYRLSVGVSQNGCPINNPPKAENVTGDSGKSAQPGGMVGRPNLLQGREIPGDREMVGVEGFEPPNGGIKTRCLTAWRHPNVSAAGPAPRRPAI